MLTRALVIFLWLIFGAELYLSQSLSPSLEVLRDMGALQLQNFSYKSLLFAGFLHANFLHIIFNTLALSSVGRVIEWTMGSFKMLLIFLGGIIGGSFFSLTFHAQPFSISVGASAGVMALFTAVFIVALVRKNTYLLRQSAITIVFALVPIIPFVDYAGHLGGAIVGLVLGSLFMPRKANKRYFS